MLLTSPTVRPICEGTGSMPPSPPPLFKILPGLSSTPGTKLKILPTAQKVPRNLPRFASSLSSWLTLLQPHGLPHCFSFTLGMVLPQGICTSLNSAWISLPARPPLQANASSCKSQLQCHFLIPNVWRRERQVRVSERECETVQGEKPGRDGRGGGGELSQGQAVGREGTGG